MTAGNDVPARLAAALDTIRAAFAEPDAEPWIVAYSGGKDSTLLLQLVWEVAAAAEPARRRPIYVVSNDTLVESPLVIDHLRRSLEVRKAIMERLKLLEEQTGQTLIVPAEIEIIDDVWRRDRIREEGRLSLLAAVGLEPEVVPA